MVEDIAIGEDVSEVSVRYLFFFVLVMFCNVELFPSCVSSLCFPSVLLFYPVNMHQFETT